MYNQWITQNISKLRIYSMVPAREMRRRAEPCLVLDVLEGSAKRFVTNCLKAYGRFLCFRWMLRLTHSLGAIFPGLPAWGWAGRAGGIIILGTLGRCIIWRCPRTLRKQEPIVPTHSKESKARHHSELPPVGAGHNARHNACGCAAARIMMPGSRTKRSNA